MWLIGNEPDCIWQDNILPEEYAHIYHDYYSFIKGRDPSSLVAPGAIVQATPLRFQWLNRVLQTYQQAYGIKMPVDLWNIHNAIVNEQRGGWGAEIPPGIDATEGRVLSFYENDNMEIFEQQIWDFRQWMAANGYRGYPLIISEYGVLMPEELGFWPWKVNAFMSASFELLQTATDPALGDPNDGYRLVQRWAWFSLDFPLYDAATQYGFNGALFDSKTGAITEYGLNYAAETSALAPLYHTDLALGSVWYSHLFKAVPSGETITRTVSVGIRNDGNQASGSFLVHLEATGPVNIALDKSVGNVLAFSDLVLTFTLTDLPVGRYSISVEIDPEGQVVESAKCNNRASKVLMVPSHIQIMPIIGR
jgi:hypothetical protein